MSSDLTFFTNEPNSTLLERFKKTLKDVQYFDILVGYFRSSGFAALHESFDSIEEVRILVGLNMDSTTYEIVESYRTQTEIVSETHKRTRDIFSDNVVIEIDAAPDSPDTEIGVRKFLDFLKSGKIKVRAIPDRNVHAKVYISRFYPDDRDFGRVITGSSNFSLPGFVTNREFNVELKGRADVEFALTQFEQLWAEGIEVNENYVETVSQRTWLNDQITPYQIYLKLLYEYFKEDINDDKLSDWALPDGVMDLEYQKQAVISAKKIIDQHYGVFIADVVGLGKTFISAMLARRLGGPSLVVCPPNIMDDWKSAMLQMMVPCTVESIGKLDHLADTDTSHFKHIFIDEAHRFRNEMNVSYELMSRLCKNKNVILVSATPLNNGIDDIYNQLKLFQIPGRSTIPGIPNLDKFFKSLKSMLPADRQAPEYADAAQAVHKELRESVLKHVMVRRTRTDVIKYFSDDLNRRHLAFPEVADPTPLAYVFDEAIDLVFNATIERLKKISYARYTPLLYLNQQISDFEKQSQRNVGGFMKGVLVKRLESSFFAFKATLGRFIESYQKFIQMAEDGTIYIGKRVDIFDLLERDSDDELLEMTQQGKVKAYSTQAFSEDFVPKMRSDLDLLLEIQDLWEKIGDDPKLEEFLNQITTDPILKKQQLLVFSESHETGICLYESLSRMMPGKVMLFSSKGGVFNGKDYGKEMALAEIKKCFDPKASKSSDAIRVLITTDVLAEGVNLHKASVVVNYDLPWNPTRVLQRVGRVNRIGTKHSKIHVFNFFPTAQSEIELGLEEAIKKKLQAFHDTLGEDAKYITDEENISTHELFGDRLLSTLTSKDFLQDGDEGTRSELEFLSVIRRVRDDNASLFDTIKRLPRKARSCRPEQGLGEPEVLTFVRRGAIKKFFLSSKSNRRELSFLETACRFECLSSTKRAKIPSDFFNLLGRNKDAFDESVSPVPAAGPIFGNIGYIIGRLKSRDIRECKKFTDEDEAYIAAVLFDLETKALSQHLCQRVKKELETVIDPLKVLAVLKANIRAGELSNAHLQNSQAKSEREVVLSECFVSEEVA